MVELTPTNVPRPDLAQDPGVRSRPSTVTLAPTRDTVGSALAGFGGEISNIADTFRALAVQRQEAEDQVFNDHWQLEYNKRRSTIQQEMISSADAAHPDFINRLDRRLADEQKNLLNELMTSGRFNVSQRGLQLAEHSAMGLRTESARQAAVEAHNQRTHSYVNIATENVLEIARQAGQSGDVEGGITRVDATVNTLTRILPPSRIAELRRAARAQIVESAAQGHIDRGESDRARMLVDRNRGFAGSELERTISAVATRNGIDPAYLISVARIESSMNPVARPRVDPRTGRPPSRASGLFQFVPGTAVEYGLPEDAASATPEQQTDAAARLTIYNRNQLRSTLGRDPTHAELYMAHFLGATDAAKVLAAPPGTPLRGLISDASIRANPGILQDRTVDQVIDWSGNRIMANGGGGADVYLPEEARRRLLSAAEQRDARDETNMRQREERERKVIREAFMQQAFRNIHDGTLTETFVERIRPFIEPNEYQTLLKTLRGENNTDDQQAIIILNERIDRDDPDSFFRRASEFMAAGRLKTSTFTTFVERNRRARADDNPASPFKAGRNEIEQSLDPNAFGGDAVMTQALRYGRAQALQAFDNWIDVMRQNNTPITRAAAMAEAGDIIRRFEPRSQEDMRLGLGMSRYFNRNVTRQGLHGRDGNSFLTSMTIIGEAEQKLRSDIANNVIPPGAMRDQEIRILNNWRRILERERERSLASRPATGAR